MPTFLHTCKESLEMSTEKPLPNERCHIEKQSVKKKNNKQCVQDPDIFIKLWLNIFILKDNSKNFLLETFTMHSMITTDCGKEG